jgi:Uma2 family endonuclease
MVISLEREIVYPDSDGQPMADNTKQFRWIVLLKENLECLFANAPQVFVAGDLLWYPVEGRPDIRVAPDVFVAFGRPKGDRGSYRQWQEENIAPQVVFEILSPGNTIKEMAKKLQFYNRYDVEEYYIYDPDRDELAGLQRLADELTVIEEINNWKSPLLGISFVLTPEGLKVYYPDGEPFLTTVELAQKVESEKQRAESEKQRAESEKQRAESEKQRAESEKQRADRLVEQLRLLGIEPNEN